MRPNKIKQMWRAGQCATLGRLSGSHRFSAEGMAREGLANLEAICATPGLDAVYIGPADLSFALGLAPRGDNPDPLHLATCDKILAAAHKAGIKCVMHCAGAAFAAGAVKRGFDMVMLTSDLSCMIAGARMQLDELKANTA